MILDIAGYLFRLRTPPSRWNWSVRPFYMF